MLAPSRPPFAPCPAKGISRALYWFLILVIGSGLAACVTGPPTASESTPGGAEATVAPPPTAVPAPLVMEVKPLASLPVQPNGQPYTDEYGTQIIAPPTVMETGEPITVALSAAEGPLAVALQEQAVIETPLYAVTAPNDSRGRVTLSLPAASPESRIVALVDDTYLAVLDQEPRDGKLELAVRVAPTGVPDLTSGNGGGGTIRYFVARPQSAASDGKLWQTLAPPPAFAADDYHLCLQWTSNTLCRTNGQIYVMWPMTAKFTLDQADEVIRQIASILRSFAQKGFTAAKSNSSIFVVIKPDLNAPAYSPKSSILSLPVDSAQTIANPPGRYELIHELAHWVQDEEYAMTVAALSGIKAWWLETTAENLVFLIEPAAQEHNLTQYGQTTVDGPKLGFQSEPFTWGRNDESRYIHAQLLKVNLCANSACALSEEELVKAINEGSYPLMDEARQAKLRANLDDYARYLLGVAPERANTGIMLPEVLQQASRVGDVISVRRNRGDHFVLSSTAEAPQIEKQTPNGRPPEYQIQAVIDSGAVYPLSVVNGGANPNTSGWPVMLTIEPGVELFYRRGDEPVTYHDGSSQLVLGPIHRGMGYDMVRVVALARNQSATFKAKVHVVDLQGDWIMVSQKVISTTVSCVNDNENFNDDPADLIKLAQAISLIVAPRGSYQWSGLNELAFVFDGGAASLTSEADDTSQFAALALISPDAIEGEMQVVFPPPATSNAAPVWLALVFVPPGILAWRSRRRIALLLVGLLMSTTLTGCVGVSISGNVDTRYTLDKLEYVGKGDTLGEPLWRISTQKNAYTDIDITIVVTVETIGDEPPEQKTTRCAGRIEHDLVIEVYRDGVINPLE
ncbi:hypothetical protein [uncultured Chloroflexus sp.]|uniref:hypothetical protein n=1 Tax=uncultured Chloroflexus sp. TaxID=214040 RepID=UPI0026160049|nr:hypothetical protein [uncultured Chloroflexus sp.]